MQVLHNRRSDRCISCHRGWWEGWPAGLGPQTAMARGHQPEGVPGHQSTAQRPPPTSSHSRRTPTSGGSPRRRQSQGVRPGSSSRLWWSAQLCTILTYAPADAVKGLQLASKTIVGLCRNRPSSGSLYLKQSQQGDTRVCNRCPGVNAEPPGTLEAKWRQDCLAFARVKKLEHVADMRIFYVVSFNSAGKHQCAPMQGLCAGACMLRPLRDEKAESLPSIVGQRQDFLLKM